MPNASIVGESLAARAGGFCGGAQRGHSGAVLTASQQTSETTMSETTTQAPTEAIFALMARLADNKYFLGRRYAEWCSSAPTLESSVAAAAMAQDELGHTRAIYPVLKTLDPSAGA